MKKMDGIIGQLLIVFLDRAGITKEQWEKDYDIEMDRLASLRAGKGTLTELDRQRIAQVHGGNWPELLIELSADQSEIASESARIIRRMHKTANSVSHRLDLKLKR
jgi:hypothetical protein